MPILKVGDKKAPAITDSSSGFSLLEAVIVIVILSFVVALVIPTFSSSYRGAVLKSTVRSTAANLRHVRASAIGSGSKKVFALNLREKAFSILPLSEQSSNSPVQSIESYIDVYEAVGAAPDYEEHDEEIRLEFLPNGSSNGSNLVFAYNNQSYLIEVSPLTGKVKVSAYQDNNPSSPPN